MNDPMLGGATVQLDPNKAYSARELSSLGDGGITTKSPQHSPKTEVTHKYAAQTPQQRAMAPSVNRAMIIAGYKGKADAWIKCFKEILHINGQQVDRHFYLSLDPREAHRQAELMEIGTQTFSTFVVLQYRDALESNPVGLPAARNLHSFVGRITEEFRNVGPVLIVLPFHTLMPGGFDFIERNYTHAISAKGVHFLGYITKKPEGRLPGAAIVLPPNWARHPDFQLAKGLNQYGNGDISYIKDEVLRAMRESDVMIGHGMKAGATTALQTFAQDEIVDLPQPAAFNPAGRPQAPVRKPEATLAERQQAVNPPLPEFVPPSRSFSAEEKEAALALISQLGMGALKVLDPARYGLTLAEDAEFANATVSKAQGHKLRTSRKPKEA